MIKKKQHSKRLTDLINILNDKVTDEQRMRPFVKHYLDKYGAVLVGSSE